MKYKLKNIFLVSMMTISTLWIFWLSLTPLIDRDATRFHLPFAKLWAENSFLYFRPYFAYYDLNMLNLNYLYMLIFKFGLPDQFTKIIHASFLIAAGYLIFKYFKNKYGFNWGALSFILFVTIPIHQRLSSEVYVDLGLLFFSTLAIIYFIKWFDSGLSNKKYLIISAVGAGLSFGTKYNGIIIVFFLTLFIGLIIARERKDDKLALKSMLIFASIVLICTSPWLIRNFINSGNPFFPLFGSIIPSNIEMPANLVDGTVGETMSRIINGNESIFSLFMLPFRVFFEGVDHDFLKFDGKLNPFLILLLPFLFCYKYADKQRRKTNIYLFALFLIVFLATLYSNSIRIRYFIPVIPILIILNIEALKNIIQSKRKYAHILFYSITAFYLIYNLNYSIYLSSNLHLSDYNPFSSRSRDMYMKKYLRLYDFFKYINDKTPEDSVVYEAFTGGRGYYVDRIFYSDTYSLDRYLLKLVKDNSEPDDYKKYFSSLPNSKLRATHLLIKPNALVHTFTDINHDENDLENIESKKKLQGYIEFINSLNIVKKQNDVYLFEL
ncbi:MAG: glycosyltransferase family 39 protein [Candidatus Delongbacteria bacterium]|nr:glycosyltransferase family 39 protein [Candidatus Delongbacteria bacterium]